MIADRRILACAALSVAAHVAFAGGLRRLPKRQDAPWKRLVSIRVVSPPPAPEPPPEPARPAPAPAPTPKAAPRARARPTPAAERPPVRQDTPPPESAPQPGDATGPVFGVSMESTSQAGSGPAMPIGSPVRPSAGGGGGERQVSHGAGEPVPEYEVTTKALPQGRCDGKYTEAAKQAGVEGTVVLDIVVGPDGRVSSIHVVSGLSDGLTEAAIAAMKACRFSPGQKNGVPVAERIRGFKIRFLLANDE